MGEFSSLILLLLPLAAATGWFIARQSSAREEQDVKELNPDYVRGLSHLVNNDTDQAIEIFIGLIEADEGTIDLHLALGGLFRRRGEVDRALRIHQNLVERPKLKPRHRNQARYELAKDYLTAGVLDRAEEIFLELAHQGMFLADCLQRLLQIYEREREWDKAIDTARWLESAQGRSLGPVIAQYHCEKADAAARRADDKGRVQQLRKALSADPHCVRALLEKAALARDAGQSRKALGYYKDVVRYHPGFIPEILEPWREAFLADHEAAEWLKELQRSYQEHPHPALQVALIQDAGRFSELDEAVQAHLLEHLKQQPSWVGVHALLEQDWPDLPASLQGVFDALAQALAVPLEGRDRYQCNHCGFRGRTLQWQCPKCQQWNAIEPLGDLSYEALDKPPRGVGNLSGF